MHIRNDNARVAPQRQCGSKVASERRKIHDDDGASEAGILVGAGGARWPAAGVGAVRRAGGGGLGAELTFVRREANAVCTWCPRIFPDAQDTPKTK